MAHCFFWLVHILYYRKRDGESTVFDETVSEDSGRTSHKTCQPPLNVTFSFADVDGPLARYLSDISLTSLSSSDAGPPAHTDRTSFGSRKSCECSIKACH